MERDVVGADGRRYRLERRLGAGGQGTVYAVAGGRLAAKLLLDRSEARRFALRAALEEVRRLPVEDLPVARPLVVLRAPECGYIMELLTGMEPVARLARPQGDDVAAWFLAGGGLRRRLAVLANAADALHALHARALAWADPSPHNIFIASDVSSDAIRLIDTDNLRASSRPGATLYTEGYAAPELKTSRSGVTTLTDAHAMAVIAFEVLTLCHPLLGDAVRAADEADEQAALRGEWPWIDHPEDTRNQCSTGLPREMVLTRKLTQLFGRIFGEALTQPVLRPGTGALSEALKEAWAATVRCPSCDGSFYFPVRECPYCSAPRGTMLLADVGLWHPELSAPLPGDGGRPHRIGVLALSDGETRSLPALLAGGAPVELRLEGARLWVKGGGSLRSPDGAHLVELGEEARPLDLREKRPSWTLHLGPLDKPHRFVTPHLHAAVHS